MKTVAIILEFWEGHHPTYLKFFSRTLLNLGCRVIAFSPSPDELREWVRLNCPDRSNLFRSLKYSTIEYSEFIPSVIKSKLSTIKRWQTANYLLNKLSSSEGLVPDLVFFAYLDVYLDKFITRTLVDLFFNYSWSGLYFAPSHLRQPNSNILSRFGLLSRDASLKSLNCSSVGLLDEGVVSKMQNLINSKVILFPDFADISPPNKNYTLCAKLQKSARGKTIIGLIGCITKRKSIVTFLKAAQLSKNENWFFFVAGSLDERTFDQKDLAFIHECRIKANSNILFDFKYIPDESSFNAVINSCDIVFAAYEDFYYSSNILTKSAYFNKMVIVSEGYCMAERVRKFKLGEIIPQGDSVQCVHAIRKLTQKFNFKDEINLPDFDGYRQIFSVERLNYSFAEVLNG